MFADVDRFEAFTPEILTATAKINYRKKNVSNLFVRLRGGPALFLGTEEFGEDADVFLDYSAQMGYEGFLLYLIGGISGRFSATSDDGAIGDRSIYQLGAAANLVLGNVRPGILFRLPLDEDLRDDLDLVLGLQMSVLLR